VVLLLVRGRAYTTRRPIRSADETSASSWWWRSRSGLPSWSQC